LIWTAYLWNCMSHDQHDLKVTYLRIIFKVIFVVFRLMKNIIFNTTESFLGRNTSNHACQIFWSISNWSYVWLIFPPRDEITVVKIMNNLNVCPAHSYLFPRSQFKHTSVLKGHIFLVLLWKISNELNLF
jgi:hypothetical protein